MKILLANKFYYRRGGDCTYVLSLEQLLKEYGHEVAVFAMNCSENLETPWKKYFSSEVRFRLGKGMWEAFMRPFGTNEVRQKFIAMMNDFQPDVVHLNNIHSQLSPVIAEIAHQRGVNVVWTLHDYKLLCPRYDCLRCGKTICEECFTDKHKVLEYKCMKDSKIASFLSYREALKWNRKRLEACTNIFICPSGFMAQKMLQGGFDKMKIYTLCNFLDIEKTRKEEYNKGDYYCYIGRLSHEKGIVTLIEVARQLPYKLKVIGGGPLMENFKDGATGTNIEFLGHKQWEEIKDLVGNARFSIIPSEWYENNPLSVIEAQCLGTPVLGACIGGIPELIEEGISGMLFEAKNTADLKQKIEAMFIHKFDYEFLAKKSQQRYSSTTYYKQLMDIYTK